MSDIDNIKGTERFLLLAQAIDSDMLSTDEAVSLYNNPDFYPEEFDEAVDKKELSDYFWDFISGTGKCLWTLAQSELAGWLLSLIIGPMLGKSTTKVLKHLRKLVR